MRKHASTAHWTCCYATELQLLEVFNFSGVEYASFLLVSKQRAWSCVIRVRLSVTKRSIRTLRISLSGGSSGPVRWIARCGCKINQTVRWFVTPVAAETESPRGVVAGDEPQADYLLASLKIDTRRRPLPRSLHPPKLHTLAKSALAGIAESGG